MASPCGRNVNFAPLIVLGGTNAEGGAGAAGAAMPNGRRCQVLRVHGRPRCYGEKRDFSMRYTPGAVAKWANWAFPSLRTVVDLFLLLFFVNSRSRSRSHSSITYLKHVFGIVRMYISIMHSNAAWGSVDCYWFSDLDLEI